MNDPIKNIRCEVTLEERYTNVSEQLANMSERYDALSSALEKERLLRSEMVNEQAASELAALRKLHEEEVARIKAEARAETLREFSQCEAERICFSDELFFSNELASKMEVDEYVNHYLFCQNEESCHYAAVMYTFFAACRVLKINPEKWLSDVLDKIPFTPKEKLSELLPQNWI